MVIIDYQQDNFQGILTMLDMTISIILTSPLERGRRVCSTAWRRNPSLPRHIQPHPSPRREFGCPFYFIGMGLENGRTEER